MRFPAGIQGRGHQHSLAARIPAALEAVAHPAQTNYLYFVAKGTDPSDGHLFAATYAEHRKNVAQYRKAEDEEARQELEQQQATEAGDTTE